MELTMSENQQNDTPAHIDVYAGEAGTFINDPATGTRIPIEDYKPPTESTAKPVKTHTITEEKT